MPETNAVPTEAQILSFRSDLASYLPTGKTLANIAAVALADAKRYLEDERDILWERVFDTTNDLYFVGYDGYARNDDKIKHAIILFVAAILFRDYSITHGGSWWELYIAHRSDAESLLKNAKLDIDIDDSSSIEESETATSGQSFMVK